MEAAERIVAQIERWPLPGNLPWEVAAIANFHSLEGRIEGMKVRAETANILHRRYFQIEMILREESSKYYPIIHALQDSYDVLAKELADLNKTLSEAVGVSTFSNLRRRPPLTFF